MGRGKITRDALRQMHIGQTCIFDLVAKKDADTARVVANQMKNIEDLVFRVSPDFTSMSVSVTRIG